MTTTFQEQIAAASGAINTINESIALLTKYRDSATAEIAKYLRIDDGIELDIDAIQATLTRPYTLLPINEHEAWLIHWRGVKMPIFGWVVSQEPAFIKAKVTRSMDLLTPLPGWMKSELGWKPPEHKAVIDGTRTSLQLTEGDGDTFKKRYGHHLGAKQADGSFKIKGGDAWIKLVAALVRDGILPYAPKPVAAEHWDAKATIAPNLLEVLEKLDWKIKRPFLQRAVDDFKQKGAVLINYPPGAGKTLVSLIGLTHFVGKVLVLGDSDTLRDHWTADVHDYLPNADVTVALYQGAGKHIDKEWDLIIFDEAQRLPANKFSKLAFAKTKYRIGLTATPWREDNRQHLIVALCGFPVYIPWAELISAGILRRPKITVATVPNQAAKTTYVKSLVANRKGKALIYCDWLKEGQALADALDVPFIHGNTTRKLEKIRESDVCVVSRVADRGVSLRDLRLVIEVAFAGKSREQNAQRVGRLLHGEFEGEFTTVFTPTEAAKYRGRIFGVEAELAGQVDIEFIEAGNVTTVTPRAKPIRTGKNQIHTEPSRPLSTPVAEIITKIKPRDEIDETLSLTAVAAKVTQAKKSLSVGGRAAPYVERVLRYCWTAALSPKEISEGLGVMDDATRGRISTACNAVEKVGLMIKDADGRYRVNQDEIQRLKTLSQLRK